MAEIFLPAFTVAEWGGLHENVCAAVAGLTSAGHSVTVAVRGGMIAERARAAGASVHVVDWGNWQSYARELMQGDYKPDLVFAQPQKSRELGQMLSVEWKVPLHLMFHGYYADGISRYEADVVSVAAVTQRIVELLTGYANIPPWRVQCIPNGIDDALFLGPLPEQFSGDSIDVVMASRLEMDKVRQVRVLREVVSSIRQTEPEANIQVRVLGDGAARETFKEELGFDGGTSVEFTGWLAPEDVASEMRTAFITVGAGRAAALSLAVGTPCVAVGKYATTGLQYDDNLRMGLWSNFGDYPVGSRPIFKSSIEADVMSCFDGDFYTDVQKQARSVMYLERRQSLVDDLLQSFLSLRVGR